MASGYRLLLDSNVLFSAEPFAGELEQRFEAVAELLRLAGKQGHTVLVHPASLDDAREDKDPTRRKQRLAELGKYARLAEAPVPASLKAVFADPAAGTRDHRDLRILAALPARAATHLVTEDDRLRRRAIRAGLGEAVLTVRDAVDLLRELVRPMSTPPPRVRKMLAYEIDPEQPIFESLRADYPAVPGRAGFDAWLDKVRADHDNRLVFVVEEEGRYAAIAIVKLVEDDASYGFDPGTSKLATFKVSPDHGGLKLGELLLKAVLFDAADRSAPGLFVEVHGHHEPLIAPLGLFGFRDDGHRTSAGELVLHKSRIPDQDAAALDDLAFHVRYGPPALRVTRAKIIPIEPRWFDDLFPDSPLAAAPPQITMSLFDEPETRPWGNALRKAYVSRKVHRGIAAGDLLLFYRSKDKQSVGVLGVVEDVLVSEDPDELVTFLGQRTVYTPAEIEGFCRRGGKVTALIFRQDRFVDPAWHRLELHEAGVVRNWPQTIAQVPEEGVRWLRLQVE